MDETLLDDAAALAATDELVRALSGQRETSRRALAEHRERFRDLEVALADQLRDLEDSVEAANSDHPPVGDAAATDFACEQFAVERTAWQQLQQDFAAQQSELIAALRTAIDEQKSTAEEVRAAHAELDARRTQLEAEESELDAQLQQVEMQAALFAERLAEVERRSEALDAVQARLQQAYTEQSRVTQQQEADRAEKAREFDDLAELRRQLHAEQEDLKRQAAEIQNLRRRVARELRAQRAEMLAEVERQRMDIERLSLGDQAELKHQVLVATTEAERMRTELSERRALSAREGTDHTDLQRKLSDIEDEARLQRSAADKTLAEAQLRLADLAREKAEAESQATNARASLAEARDDLEQLRQRLTDSRERLDSKEAELNQLRALATERTTATAAIPVEITRELETLREEREELLAHVDRLKGASSGGEADTKEIEHLRRRLEMAVQDLREVKSKNSELETALAKAKSGAPMAAAALASGPLDWEAQKQRLLARLESESAAEEDAAQAETRLSIEGTIRLTDEIIAAKDRELTEAQRLLEEQSNYHGGMAVGANAIAALLDQDELIRSEREQLKLLQEQLQEKLRAAEIDLSRERAKIARDRAEFQEKIAALESERNKGVAAANSASSDNGKKPSRNRWLNRLSLRDGEQGAE